MKKQIVLFLLTILTLPIFAAVTVSGRVVDTDTQRPIEFVTVSVVNKSNQKTAGGALTNEFGVFNISNIQNGDYELRVSFVGYESFSRDIKVENTALVLGSISLKENAKELKEVQVVGQGSQMRFDIDIQR